MEVLDFPASEGLPTILSIIMYFSLELNVRGQLRLKNDLQLVQNFSISHMQHNDVHVREVIGLMQPHA